VCAVHQALLTLAAWNLVESRARRWSVVAWHQAAWSPDSSAASTTLFARKQGRHRQERIDYRRALRIVDGHLVTGIDLTGSGVVDNHCLLPPEPPPDEDLPGTLHGELGAYLTETR